MDIENTLTNLMELGSEYGLKVIGAILIWIIGSWVIKRLVNALQTVMSKANYDEGLKKFLVSLAKTLLMVLLVLSILGNLGVETTSFAAVIAAAGLAVGMALQGSLSNFAGGVILLIFKPFKVGDLIEGQGELGKVKEIDIFTTKLLTPENKLVIIPNGALSNGNIINYSEEGMLEIRHVIGVSYDADIKKTKEVLMEVLTSQEKVLKSPPPTINVTALGESSVDFAVRPWAKVEDYWSVYFMTLEKAKLALDAAGIEIPYPHSVEISKEA